MWLVCSFEDTDELRKFKGEGIIWDYYTWLVVTNPSEKYYIVSWDDYSDYIYIMENKIHVPNHQPESILAQP